MLIEVRLAQPSQPPKMSKPNEFSLRAALTRAKEAELSLFDGTLAVNTDVRPETREADPPGEDIVIVSPDKDKGKAKPAKKESAVARAQTPKSRAQTPQGPTRPKNPFGESLAGTTLGIGSIVVSEITTRSSCCFDNIYLSFIFIIHLICTYFFLLGLFVWKYLEDRLCNTSYCYLF
jgi:hypothetical protein